MEQRKRGGGEFVLTGRVVDVQTGHGLADVRVEAWDKERLCNDLVACGFTDALGVFRLVLEAGHLRELFLERVPVLFFRLFEGSTGIATTDRSVLWRVERTESAIRIEINRSSRKRNLAPAPFVVRGRVVTPAGAPCSGLVVRAYNRSLREEQLLGEATTSLTGSYRIVYAADKLAQDFWSTDVLLDVALFDAGPGTKYKKSAADLVVRVFNEERVVAAEKKVCHAPPTATVNLMMGGEIYRGPSAYERLVLLLAPALRGTSLVELRDEDVHYLACSLRIHPAEMEDLVAAARLSKDVGVHPAALYGLFREGLPRERRALLATRPAEQRRALILALEHNLIPATLRDDIDAILDALHKAGVLLAFEAAEGGFSLGDLLAVAFPERSAQEVLISNYLRHEGPVERFWQALREHPAFKKEGLVERVQLVLQLGALTRQYLPLVRALDEWRLSGMWSSLADLAKFSEADWIALLNKDFGGAVGYPSDTPGADDKEKSAHYARLLFETLAKAFPAMALAAHLHGQNDQDLVLFFSKNPDFEFGKTRVRSYLQEKPGALDGLSSPKSATANLEALERLFKVTPNSSAMNALFSAGIHSAQSIQKLGKSAFINSYAQVLGGQSKAESFFFKAEQITSGALALFGKYAAIARPPALYVLPGPDPESVGDAAALMDIFGPQDLCACEHCASIYGPAAYLVDVLDFLGRYAAKQNKPEDPITARDVLLARRPDIARVELSCENTLTEVPYVDLADEILEFRLAHAIDPTVVLDAHIKTVGTTEELALSPQPIHGNARFIAHKALAQGKFLPAPPFNVWAEETDILLAHLGTSRAELVDVFSQAPANPTPPATGLLEAFSALLKETNEDAIAFFSAVAERAGLPTADLDVLVDKLGMVFPASYQDEGAVNRLWNALNIVKGFGVSASRAISWATTTAPIESADPAVLTAPAIANDVRLAVKARYTEDAWPEIGRVLRDDLRERQRKALVSAALALSKYDSTNDLFAELLIDVEMSPAPTTSRIQQAISSVQLFAQRCFMGLEPAVTSLDDEAVAQWAWMKSYRVWEANRKIFFHPENWIEPELRDDKTPFFRELENELLQGDINDARAEGAFRKYLQKLHDVAHLDVVAVCEDRIGIPGANKNASLHVIARTHVTPHVYYHRQRIEGRFWSPWEKLDLDIQGDTFLAVVHNRRLYLFWALLEEADDIGGEAPPMPKGGKPTGHNKAKEYDLDDGGKPQPDIDVDIDEPHKSPGPKAPTVKKKPMRLRLAWSERQNGRWSPRKTGPEEQLTLTLPEGDPATLSLWASIAGARLTVICAIKETTPPDRTTHVCRLGLGCDGRLEVEKTSITRATIAALGTSLVGQEFVKKDESVGLWLRGFALTDKDVQVLGTSPRPYAMVVPYRGVQLALTLNWGFGYPPFFYKDGERTFFVQMTERPQGDVGDEDESPQNPWIQFLPGMPIGPFGPQIDISPVVSVELDPRQVRFEVFYHPHACAVLEALERDGADGLFGWPADGKSVQLRSDAFFEAAYAPEDLVVATPYPVDDIDFSFGGAYSQYNWEVFFHAPFLIACMLMKNHRHEEAQRWFHRIFDPTPGAAGGPERFWKVKPLREKADPKTLAAELQALAGGDVDAIGELAAQIEAWREEPFNPHLIARMRPIAYQRAVVMKYIDSLIAWGDNLFSQDTREAINEATGLYILAADILGPKPVLNKKPEDAPKTYAELLASAPLVDLENLIPELNGAGDVPFIDTAHFAIPPNDKLLGYWDLVADRLFKIRHGLNIEGQARPLPLFAPPIDPALLVKAAAMGVDWKDVSEVVPMPHYRFGVLHAKATEFCNGVIVLGAALLSALEKKDAEKLTMLRATHETAMLTATREVKKRQIDEAKQTLAGLKKAREAAAIRFQHYTGLPFMNSYEEQAMMMSSAATFTQFLMQATHTESAGASLLPTAITGGAGIASPAALIVYGGENAAKSGESFGNALGALVSLMRDGAAMSSTMGYYTRRAEDAKLQEKIAAKEIEQLDKQIVAAEIRLAIAERDLENNDIAVENGKTVEATLRDKFTNEALYSWTLNEISIVYFEAYKLALGMARRAAKAFKHELAVDPPNVSPTHWDNTRNGLLAGEKLLQQLRQMEAAYLDQNQREYEITKHISLAQLDPQKLLELKQKGVCEFNVPEIEFDLDFPGHYLRRVKTVSLSIPCVTDAYGTLFSTLSVLIRRVRKSTELAGGYAEKVGDGRFTAPYIAPISVAISGAQSDGGAFELSLRDERYLPFEGAGAIGTWKLELSTNNTDLDGLSDVVLHVRYTAREGDDALKTAAKNNAAQLLSGLRLFSVKDEFPTAWHHFLKPDAGAAAKLVLPLEKKVFPRSSGGALQIKAARLFAAWKNPADYFAGQPAEVTVSPPVGSALQAALVKGPAELGDLATSATLAPAVGTSWTTGSWTFSATSAVSDKVENIWVLCDFTRQGA